jgi:LytR cell envelope-related transcriptional attenuator
VTEPAPSGGPSPLRVGGLALLGAGAVAALIGLATLLPGGGGATAPTTTEAPPPTAAPTPVATSAPAVVPTVGPTATNAIAAPTAPPVVPVSPAPVNPAPVNPAPVKPVPVNPAAGGGGPAVAHAPVRVYNNSTITGLAARAADDFRANGWQVSQVANYPSGIIATSTVYYRPGTAEQSAASSLASAFGLRVEPRFTGIDDATPGLIVIVTNDYQKRK